MFLERLLLDGAFNSPPSPPSDGTGGQATRLVLPCYERGPSAHMSIRQRNLVTAFFAYFMAWSIVALPSVPIQLFSAEGMGLVLVIGTPVAVVGIMLNMRAERPQAPS